MPVHPLQILAGTYLVHRFPAHAPLPEAALYTEFFHISRTENELSVVCSSDCQVDSPRSFGPLRALRVSGTLDFALIGILASLTATLAQAKISVFAISTFDTDYLLVAEQDLPAAKTSLTEAGHVVQSA